MASEDFKGTYGALLLGAFISACLTGVATVQALLYFKMFPYDRAVPKILVFVVWSLDMAHSAMVWMGIWVYLIERERTMEAIDFIPLTISLSIVITAFLTFLVHMFFADRIHRLSEGNWLLTTPILVLALARLAFACVTSAQMIRLMSFKDFVEVSSWSFTLGLALSSAVDVLITVALWVLLRETIGPDTMRLERIIDSLVLYTIEIGTSTSAFTIVSMICWLTMQHNLVFLGLHFIIGKLYANSLLATLNTRRSLRATQRRLNEVDVSRIVRDDLRFHFNRSRFSTTNLELTDALKSINEPEPAVAPASPPPPFDAKDDHSHREYSSATRSAPG